MTPDEFRDIRNSLGLTQAQIAALVGLKDKAKVSNIETGHRPCPWHIGQLARCYLIIHQGLGPDFIPQGKEFDQEADQPPE